MSAIHYKFSSSTEYKNVTFDGINISLTDLKRAIMEKQKLKHTELDLHITNAQTLQVYKDESALIPKNTAVLVRRIPLGPVRDSKVYVVKRNDASVSSSYTIAAKSTQDSGSSQPVLSFEELSKTSNLAEANASEEDKIKAAIAQSTNEYDPSNFMRPPRHGTYNKYTSVNPVQTASMRCFRCNQIGHYSTQCNMSKIEADRLQKVYRHATGIPRSHMIEVTQKSKGAMLTTDGKYVVPFMDKKGYEVGKKERPPFVPQPEVAEEEEEDEPIPDELICLLCKDLLVDAVVIPCCGNSYCDECIRNALLDSEDHKCPTCHKNNISPDSLIANKFLRQAVNKFKNDTGIAKKRSSAPVWPRPAPSEAAKPKVVQKPMKVNYGPPKSQSNSERVVSAGAYMVKAKTEQIVNTAYNVSKREVGSSSPSEANQPIRIKLGGETNAESSTSSTPSNQSSAVATPQSENYTFNSTPDTTEEKPVVVVEPVPPGVTPPSARVVRPLMETSEEKKASDVTKQLEGIHPLPASGENVQQEADQENNLEPATQLGVDTTEKAEVDPNILQTDETSTMSLPKLESNTPTSKIEQNVIRNTTAESSLPKAAEVNATAIPLPVLPPVNMSIPPPSLPGMPPILAPTTQAASFPQSILVPPPNAIQAASQLFQRPPPPFPFPPFFPHLGSLPFSQPPPQFTHSIPPPGINIQSAVRPPASLPAVTGIMSVVPSISQVPSSKTRSSHTDDRPKRRDDRRRHRTKADLLFDEFSRNRSKSNRHRSRRSYSRSSLSDSGSTSSSSSSYSSYTGSSWSSSSSRSPRRKEKRSKKSHRRSRSHSRDQSRGRARASKRKYKSPPRSRNYSRSISRSLSPRDRRGRARGHSRNDHRNTRQFKPRPSIPVIGTDPSIPGLPSKEAADFERDQALYAHYRQAYERDWYERGIMPPPPYDRFIQPRYSRSPSPPGTSNPVLPTMRGRWRGDAPHSYLTQQAPVEPYKAQDNNNEFYSAVGSRLQPAGMSDSARYRRKQDNEQWIRNRGRRDDRRRRDEKQDSQHVNHVDDDGDATPVRDERPPPDDIEDVVVKKSESSRRSRDDKRGNKRDVKKREAKSQPKGSRRHGSRTRDDERRNNKNRRETDQSLKSKSKSENSTVVDSTKSKVDSTKSAKSVKLINETSQVKPISAKKKISITIKSMSTVDNKQSKEAYVSEVIPEIHNAKSDKNKENLLTTSVEKSTKVDDHSMPDKSALSGIPEVEKQNQMEIIEGAVATLDQSPSKVIESNKQINDEVKEGKIKLESSNNDDATEAITCNVLQSETPHLKEHSEDSALTVLENGNSNKEVLKGSGDDKLTNKNIPVPQLKETKRGPSPIIFSSTAPSKEVKTSVENVPPAETGKSRRKTKEMLSVEAKQRLSNLITPAFAVKPHKSKSTAHGVDKGKVTSQRRRKDKSNSEKLVEYDGTAPPPTGDELVKINLPKSRWEESDEDNKRDDNASGDIGNKTRKIRIKRKPHHDEQVKSVDEFESSKSSDARMVITLSKQDENIKTRKVSIAGNKDSSAGGDDDRSQDKSMKSSTVSSRDAQDCYPDQDALDLEPLSGFSNTESLSDKADKKKKKKKKKKRKHKHKKKFTNDSSDDLENSKGNYAIPNEKLHDVNTKSYQLKSDMKNVDKRKTDSMSPDQRIRKKRKSEVDSENERKRRRRGRSSSSDHGERERKSRHDRSRDRRDRNYRDEDTQRKRRVSYDSGSRERSRNHGKKRKKHRKRKHRPIDDFQSNSGSDS